MKRLSFLLSLLLSTAQAQPVVGPLEAQNHLQELGLTQLFGSPYRQPRSTDDVTAGIQPSMVWRSNGSTWVNISAGAGQAIWQRVEQFPLPADVVGYYVSAAAVHSGAAGTGYVTGNTVTLEGGVVLTVTASGGAVTGLAVTVPNMYGVCSPTTSAAPVLSTNGTGTGLTVDLTLLYPTFYAVRRVSQCYTGNLLRVENSVTTQTKDIGYLSDNSMDVATALAFGTGGAQMEQYANYNDGPTPNVATWYDQGGNPSPNNATQATVAQMPVLFAGRKVGGNNVAVLFNSQGSTGGGLPYPSATSLTIPSSLTVSNSGNATILVAGGDIGYSSAFISLTQSGGTGNSPFGIVDGGPSTCFNSATGGAGSKNGSAFPIVTETPMVMQCVWNGGVLMSDSTYLPGPSTTVVPNSIVAGTTYSLTIGTGSTCNVPTSYTQGYRALPGDTAAAVVSALVATLNADPTFGAAGITFSHSMVNSNAFNLYQPTAGSCSITPTNMSLQIGWPANGAGYSYAGGVLGVNQAGTFSGLAYEGLVAVIPWALTPTQAYRLRQSIHHHFDFDGHPGLIVHDLVASNVAGYLTPFLQDSAGDLPKILGRSDVVVINKSGAGASLVTNAASWATNPAMSYPLEFLTTGNPSNNLVVLNGEVNSLSSVGSGVTEYNAIQTIAGYAHAAGWRVLCAGSYQANFTAIQSSEMVNLQTLLNTTPGACDRTFDPTTIKAFDTLYPGPWVWPVFTKSGSGSHTSALGNGLQASLAAEVIRGMIQ